MHKTFMYRNPEGVNGIKAAETTGRINITIQVFTSSHPLGPTRT